MAIDRSPTPLGDLLRDPASASSAEVMTAVMLGFFAGRPSNLHARLCLGADEWAYGAATADRAGLRAVRWLLAALRGAEQQLVDVRSAEMATLLQELDEMADQALRVLEFHHRAGKVPRGERVGYFFGDAQADPLAGLDPEALVRALLQKLLSVHGGSRGG